MSEMTHISYWKMRKSTLVKFSKTHFLLGFLVRTHQNHKFSSKINKFCVWDHKTSWQCLTALIIIPIRSLNFKEVSWIPYVRFYWSSKKIFLTPKSQQWVKKTCLILSGFWVSQATFSKNRQIFHFPATKAFWDIVGRCKLYL